MNSQISTLIDSGKKIKSRTDKMLLSLAMSKFSGTAKVNFPDNSEGKIIFKNNEIVTAVTPQKLAVYIEKSYFILESTVNEEDDKNSKNWQPLEFTYRIIENIDREKLIKYSVPFIADYLTIKPEAAKLEFISKELQTFKGREKFQILPFFQKNYRIIYFLLLSRFAAIIPSSPEEREIILERAQSILRDGEGYERKSVAVKEESKEEQLINFLNEREKYRDVFDLFELKHDADEKELQKAYLKLVQKIHPDRLHDISQETTNRAVNLFRTVSEVYEMLKNKEERDMIIKLMKRYDPIKSRSDFSRLREYDDAIFKGTALERLGQFAAAKEIYGEIYRQTKVSDALERKITAHWQMRKKWDLEEKRKNYFEIKEDINTLKTFKDPQLETLYILIEIHEFFEEIADCMKVIAIILRLYPEDQRAVATRNRIKYYESLKKKK